MALLTRPVVVRAFTRSLPKVPKPVHRSSSSSSSSSDEDHRPPWVFTTTRFLNIVVAPSIVLYSVFFADFGEREHIFSPVRRWAARQKAAFFTLSPSELRLLEAERDESAEIASRK